MNVMTPNGILSKQISDKLNQLAVKEAEFSQKLFTPLAQKTSQEFEKEIETLKGLLKRELDMAERYGMDSFSREQIESIEQEITNSSENHIQRLKRMEEIQEKATSKDGRDFLQDDFNLIEDFPPRKEYLKEEFYKEMENAQKAYEKEMASAGIVSLNKSNQEVKSFNDQAQSKGKAVAKVLSLACVEGVRKQYRSYLLMQINSQAKIIRHMTQKQATHIQKQMSKNPFRKARRSDEIALNEAYDKAIKEHGLKLTCLRNEYQDSLRDSVKDYEESIQLRESIGLQENKTTTQNLNKEVESGRTLDSIIEKAQARYREICRPVEEQDQVFDVAR